MSTPRPSPGGGGYDKPTGYDKPIDYGTMPVLLMCNRVPFSARPSKDTFPREHDGGLGAGEGGTQSDVFTYTLITDAETQP
jgi:hypothetical protein